jgi:hypothetical protein
MSIFQSFQKEVDVKEEGFGNIIAQRLLAVGIFTSVEIFFVSMGIVVSIIPRPTTAMVTLYSSCLIVSGITVAVVSILSHYQNQKLG